MPVLSLIAKLGLDKTGFDAGLASAGKQAGRFGERLASAFTVAAVTAFTKSIVDLGSEIKDTMDRLGVGARDVQEFQLAARLGGQGAEIFARAIEKVRIAMVEGMASGQNPLSSFGITMSQLKSGDAVGILRSLAVGMEDFAGGADQTKALADVFGSKGMGAVINMLRELKNTGGIQIIEDDQVDMLDELGDKAKKLWHNIKTAVANAAMGGVFNLRTGQWENLPKREKRAPINTEGTAAQLEAAEKASKALADIENKTADQLEKNRTSQMTDEERINDLLSQRIELIKELGFALTKEAEAAIQLKIAQNAGDIIAAQGKVKPSVAKGFTVGESALGRIGAFSGASSQAGLGATQMQQLDKLTKIHDALVRRGIVVRDVAQ